MQKNSLVTKFCRRLMTGATNYAMQCNL